MTEPGQLPAAGAPAPGAALPTDGLPLRIHFLGICGYAVSGAALVAQGAGHLVSGSDDGAYPPTTDLLTAAGIAWVDGSDPANLDRFGEPGLVVVGNQTRPGNAELAEVRRRGLRVISEIELWGELTADRLRIAVCGTHGKTTTGALLAWMLDCAGMSPGFRLGATTHDFGAAARLGGVDAPFVFEGDEYTTAPWDRRPKFLHTHPTLACVTNLEHDHPDIYADLDAYRAPFVELARTMPAAGRLILCADDIEAAALAQRASCAVEGYGTEAGRLRLDGSATTEAAGDGRLRQRFVVVDDRASLRRRFSVTLSLPGRHNRLNTLAALLLATDAGAELDACLTAAASFQGPTRRFDLLGVAGGVSVVDDYGHHPAEVAAVIGAARERYPRARLVVLNIPHTYSRTRALLDAYHRCYSGADVVLVGPIEAARERGMPATVDNHDVARAAEGSVPQIATIETPEEAIDVITVMAQPGDVVCCISLGGYFSVAHRLLDALRERHGG